MRQHKTKRYSFIILGAILYAALCIFQPVSAEEKIRIGVSLPLTGPASTYGIDIKNSLIFANNYYGKNRYELIFEDDRCNPKEAVTIAKKFTSSPVVKFVLGFPCSGTILSAAPIYERAGTLVIAALSSAKEVSNAGEYIYRARPTDLSTIEMLTNYISQKHERVGVLAEETEYAQSIKNDLVKAAEKKGRKIYSESFLSQELDLRTTLLRFKQHDVQGLVILTQTEHSSSLALKQAKEVKLSAQFYGSNAMSSLAFLKLAGSDADGVIIASLPSTDEILTPLGREFFAAFTKEHGPLNSVDYAFYCAIESYRSMQAAIESGIDPKIYLNQTTFDGIFGKYSYDSNGDLVGLTPSLRVVEKGRFKSLLQ